MKYRIATNTYPVITIIADGFSSEQAAIAYARNLEGFWIFGHHMWHVESY